MVENDPPSGNEEFIEIDVGVNAAEMSDGEVQSELKVMHRWSDYLNLEEETTVVPTSDTPPLATPTLQSVVVIPERQRSSSSTRSKVVAQKSPVKTKTAAKVPKRTRTQKGYGKNNAGKAEGSLVALLSKVTMVEGSKSLKPSNEHIKESSTPTTAKRLRSTGTTPEGVKAQPEKFAKIQGEVNRGSTAERISNDNLLERRTLHLKVCLTTRPLNGNEMQKIKKFLQYQIEKVLEEGAKFIPTFAKPCRIEKDGVYIYCKDQTSAQWVAVIIGVGVPEVSGRLKVLPQETPLKFEPESISVRVVTYIPTKRPKHQILKDIAQLNRELNTERWCVKNVRPKGSGSMVYMRMDKRSFDTISERVDNEINWILGPINVRKEEHRSQIKNPGLSSVNKEVETTGLLGPTNRHFKPPSFGSVDGTPAGMRLSKNGQSGPSGSDKAILKEEGHKNSNNNNNYHHTTARSTS